MCNNSCLVLAFACTYKLGSLPPPPFTLALSLLLIPSLYPSFTQDHPLSPPRAPVAMVCAVTRAESLTAKSGCTVLACGIVAIGSCYTSVTLVLHWCYTVVTLLLACVKLLSAAVIAM
jgi:hypothetical protein